MSLGGPTLGHCSCWPLPGPPVTQLNFVVHPPTWIPMPMLSPQGVSVVPRTQHLTSESRSFDIITEPQVYLTKIPTINHCLTIQKIFVV